MVKLEELMLGNYVTFSVGTYLLNDTDPIMPCKVKRINEVSADVTMEGSLITYNRSINDLHPIPLTPEILILCGFKKDESVFNDYVNNAIKVRQRGVLFSVYRYYDKSEEVDYFCDVLHLHQLQNLYFLITKKHLNYEQQVRTVE